MLYLRLEVPGLGQGKDLYGLVTYDVMETKKTFLVVLTKTTTTVTTYTMLEPCAERRHLFRSQGYHVNIQIVIILTELNNSVTIFETTKSEKRV